MDKMRGHKNARQCLLNCYIYFCATSVYNSSTKGSDGCDQINADRRLTKLDDLIRMFKVRRREVQRAKAEQRKGLEDSPRIGGIGPDQDIEIPRVSRRAMKGKGITADDQVFNALPVEQREQLSEVGLYLHAAAF